MRSNMEWRHARLVHAAEVAADVKLLDFAVDGPLPRFDPGSHCNFRIAHDDGTLTRTYSSLPSAAGHIRVAVKRHEHSRGGSRLMWSLKEGDEIELTVPENRFELSWRASRYLLMAGGIGVTPIYGMALALAERGLPFRMVYGGRNRDAMAFASDLEAALGERIELFPGNADRRIDIVAEIAGLAADGELYVCGPIRMLNAVKAAWLAAGRPMGRLRYEVFGDSGEFAEGPFRVEVARRNVSVDVRADQTLLDALLGAGVEMIYDCKRGECGLCTVEVLEHASPIDHRDVFFSEEEKRAGKRMCACVSRLAGGDAVIDVGYRP